MSELSTRIQFKRDTSANWNAVSSTFILLSGELGFETDTKYVKIGVGDTWGNTPYIKIDDISGIAGLEAALTALDIKISQEVGDLCVDLSNEISALSDALSNDITSLSTNLSNEISTLSGALSGAINTKLDEETFNQISNYTGLSAAYLGNEVVTKNDIKGLSGAMILVGKVDKEEAPLLSTGSNAQLSDLFNVIPLGRTPDPFVGDVVIQTQPSQKDGETVDKEFVWTSQNRGQWNELGSEGIYATKVELEAEAQSRSDNDKFLSDEIGTLSSNLNSEIETLSANLSNEISTKIWIKDEASAKYAEGDYGSLSVIKVTEDEYMEKVVNGTLLKDGVLYVISSDHINAYGQKIINVETPTDLSDAANKAYVDTEVKKVADSAISAIELNGLEFDISNNKAVLNIGKINCGTALELTA